jgi:hypothetical protein
MQDRPSRSVAEKIDQPAIVFAGEATSRPAAIKSTRPLNESHLAAAKQVCYSTANPCARGETKKRQSFFVPFQVVKIIGFAGLAQR